MSSLQEMKEAIQRTLVAKGILGQLRVSAGCWRFRGLLPSRLLFQAQVRAAVFTAIDSEERKKGIYTENPRLQQLIESPEGAYLVGLLDDFCQYYGLAFSRSTLSSETSLVSSWFHLVLHSLPSLVW